MGTFVQTFPSYQVHGVVGFQIVLIEFHHFDFGEIEETKTFNVAKIMSIITPNGLTS